MKQLIMILLLISMGCANFAQPKSNTVSETFVRNKVKGLLTGTLIGDALGGPIEFQGHPEIQAAPHPPKLWTDTTDLMDDAALKAAGDRLYLREYKYVLPYVQSYGCWTANAPAGSITDDSRMKIILLYTLRKALQTNQWPATEKTMAKGITDWSKSKTIKRHTGYDSLCKDWMFEINKSINWMNGNRKPGQAYPLERMWNALPTCYGQMTLPPMAAIYPGEPEKAYLAAYQIAFFDNGFAKDMNASIVAGLSVALTLDPSTMTNEQLWNMVMDAMKKTDPYDYGKVPWCARNTDKWLYLANLFAEQANGSPAKLFKLLDEETKYDNKWEAHVPFVLVFSVLKLCKYNPLAALELSIEWGWDHDSFAQLMGAFVGAIYGPEIFRADMRATITKRLQADYDESIDEWVNTLMKVQQLGKTKLLFKSSN